MSGTNLRDLAGFAAAAIAVVTALVVAVVATLTRPRRPHTADADPDLPGDLSPALANLVTEGFEPTREAAAATVLDLAARRHLDVEEYGSDNVLIRLRTPATPDPLSASERYVLDHLDSRAVEGVVPAEDLGFGSEEGAERWWKGLRGEVVREGRQRGLCRRRWPVWLRGLVVGAALACAALSYAFSRDSSATTVGEVVGWAAFAVVGLLAIVLSRSDRQRDTPEGLAAGRRWLALRAALVDSGSFGHVTPGAVVLWDRYLAYAAGFGLAPLTVERLPLGVEDPHRAWSSVTGRWRRVEVHYPRFRPGWGRHPVRAVAACLVKGALAGVLCAFAVGVAADPGRVSTGLSPDARHWVARIAAVVAAVVGAFLVLQLWVLLLAVGDLFARCRVEGLAVRTRQLLCPTPDRTTLGSGWTGASEHDPYRRRDRCFVAVDDGSAPGLRAFAVPRELFATVAQGQQVRVECTPRLRWVRSLEPVGATPGPSVEVDDHAASAADGGGDAVPGSLEQRAAALVASRADPPGPAPASGP